MYEITLISSLVLRHRGQGWESSTYHIKSLSRLSLPRFFTFYRSPITNFFLCLVSPLHFLFPSLFFFFEAASLNFCFFSGGGFIIVVTVIELSGMEKATV